MRLRLRGLPLLAGIVFTVAAAAAPLQALASPGGGPSGGIGVRLVDTPATALDRLGRSYIVNQLPPGTTLRRRVEIRNSTYSTAVVAFYVSAATLDRGTFSFAPGHSRNELASWTSVSRSVVRLPPGAGAFETVTIKVPKEAAAGERYALAWAEVSAPPSVAGGVTLVNRVGVRMYVSIGPGGLPPAKFAIGALTARRSVTGAPLVVALVRNTGKRALVLGGTLSLTEGPGGLRAGPFAARVGGVLAPSGTMPVIVVLDRQLPPGPWRAQLSLNSGFVQRSAEATLTFPRVVAAPANSAGSRRLLLVVSLLSVLVAGAALAFVGIQRMLRVL